MKLPNITRKQFITAVLAMTLYIAGYAVGSIPNITYDSAAELQARATPTSVITITPKPNRTATVTSTTQLGTNTPIVATDTPTAVVVTITPTYTVTPIAGDPCSHWHAWQVDIRYPTLGAFSYGFNPCESIALYGDYYEQYLIAQNVDGLPHSSDTEEPNGWRWLRIRVNADGTQDTGVEPGTGCAYFDNNPDVPPEERTCITNLTVRVHNPGDATHAKKRHHSVVAFARVCDDLNGLPVEPCGTVGVSAREDWGPKHQPYKTQLCYDDTTPRDVFGNLYPLSLIDQPPYVAFQTARNGFAHQFISTITFNPNVEPYYQDTFPELPNHVIRMSWNLMDAKEVFSCNGEPMSTGYDASAFILHAFIFANLPVQRPFEGFTTINGYGDNSCNELSNVCMFMYISETVPQGIPFLSYPVQFDGKFADGTSTGVIIQEFNP